MAHGCTKTAHAGQSKKVTKVFTSFKESVKKEGVNPLEPGDTRLVGRQFDWDGRRWYIESYAIMDGSGAVGFYAFDTRRWTSATLLLDERCQRFDGAALLDLEIQLGTQQAKTNAARAEAFMLQLSMPAATERPERRRIRGRVAVGKVGGGGSEGDEVEARRKGWLPVYVGRNTQRLLDFAGGEGLGCPGRINAKDNAAREATCQLCAQREREPLTFAWTEAEGVERLDHMLTRTARRNRDKALDRCAEKMAEGCNLLILCHCRWWREESGPGRRCHGDGIARELERRANAIIGAQPDEPAGFAFRLSGPRDGTAQPLGPGPPQKSPTPPPPPQPTTTHQPPPARPTRPQMGAGEAALGQDARTAARRMADTTEALAAASTTTETQPTPSLENSMTRDLEGRSRAAADTGGDDGRPVAEAATACSPGGGGDGAAAAAAGRKGGGSTSIEAATAGETDDRWGQPRRRRRTNQ